MNKIIEQKIKDAADIVEVVEQFTTLHRQGIGYVGLCPLHDDRTIGSFVVNPRRNICSCWACSKTGLDPIGFLKEKGFSYKDALLFIAKLKHIDVEGDTSDFKIEPRKELPPLKMLTMNRTLAAEAYKLREQDTLVRWLRSLRWDAAQAARIDEVLRLYVVGLYTVRNQQYTVFWQTDEALNIRSGKLMAYKQDGHRDKNIHPRFVHRLFSYDDETYEYKATFFGMHLLNRFPEATVNIVESEKTALIMSIAHGINQKSIWMATGGMQNLRREILQPIIEQKRDVILYPDKDGIRQWKERQLLINYKNMTVNTDLMRKYWTEADGPKADIADIIVRLLNRPTQEDDIVKHYPGIKPLVDKLDLKVCTE